MEKESSQDLSNNILYITQKSQQETVHKNLNVLKVYS